MNKQFSLKRKVLILILAFSMLALCACAAPAAQAPMAPAPAPAAAAPAAPAPQDSMSYFESAPAPAMDAGYGYEMEEAIMDEEYDVAPSETHLPASAAQNQAQPHMIIRNADITIETVAFDVNLKHIEDKVASIGGYIEYSFVEGKAPEEGQTNGRYASLTARVPQEQFEAFIRDVEGSGTVTSLRRGSEDVTMQYYDNESRIETLQIQLDRLEEILTKSEKLADVLALETEIARIRYEIESLTTTQRRYAQLVQYSTVTVNLYEVVEVQYALPEAESMGSQISDLFINVVNGLGEFFEWLVIILIGLSPILILAAVVLIIIFSIRRRRRRKRIEQGLETEEPAKAPKAPKIKRQKRVKAKDAPQVPEAPDAKDDPIE